MQFYDCGRLSSTVTVALTMSAFRRPTSLTFKWFFFSFVLCASARLIAYMRANRKVEWYVYDFLNSGRNIWYVNNWPMTMNNGYILIKKERTYFNVNRIQIHT